MYMCVYTHEKRSVARRRATPVPNAIFKKNQLAAGSSRARQIFFQYPRGLQHNPLS